MFAVTCTTPMGRQWRRVVDASTLVPLLARLARRNCRGVRVLVVEDSLSDDVR